MPADFAVAGAKGDISRSVCWIGHVIDASSLRIGFGQGPILLGPRKDGLFPRTFFERGIPLNEASFATAAGKHELLLPRFLCSCGHEWSGHYAISCPMDADDGALHRIRFINYVEICGLASMQGHEPPKKEPNV